MVDVLEHFNSNMQRDSKTVSLHIMPAQHSDCQIHGKAQPSARLLTVTVNLKIHLFLILYSHALASPDCTSLVQA